MILFRFKVPKYREAVSRIAGINPDEPRAVSRDLQLVSLWNSARIPLKIPVYRGKAGAKALSL